MPVQQEAENYEGDRERQCHQNNDQHFEAGRRELRQSPYARENAHGGGEADHLADYDISPVGGDPSIESGE